MTYDQKETKTLASKILLYYDHHQRELPWRAYPTPYHIWLSEIMLQQTRVETVVNYFQRFVTRFPSIESLAEGQQETVLKLWEGLGYYSRARHLHESAKQIVHQYGGKLPSDVKTLASLPGIGPYTAAAIASMAYGVPAVALDGNLIRVACRLAADDQVIKSVSSKRRIEAFWSKLMPLTRPGDFNQAIMDIGATICLPKGVPLCEQCPIQDYCEAYKKGNPLDYPVLPLKKKRQIRKKTVLLVLAGDRIWIEKRAEKGLLSGLWQFPMKEGHLTKMEVMALFASEKGGVESLNSAPSVKHIFTHLEWHMSAWLISCKKQQVEQKMYRQNEKETEKQLKIWVPIDSLESLPFPVAHWKYRQIAQCYLQSK